MSKLKSLKRIPWIAVAQVAVVVNKRWASLSARERERLSRLLRDSGGRPGNLSAKERGELRKLAGKLDLKGIGRDALPLLRGSKRKRRK